MQPREPTALEIEQLHAGLAQFEREGDRVRTPEELPPQHPAYETFMKLRDYGTVDDAPDEMSFYNARRKLCTMVAFHNAYIRHEPEVIGEDRATQAAFDELRSLEPTRPYLKSIAELYWPY